MPERDFTAGFLVIQAALCFVRQSPLLANELIVRFLQIARVGYLFTSAQVGGTLDADISADSLSGLRRSCEFEDLVDKQYVPSIIATGDEQLCTAAFKRAGESDPATTYAKLRNSQLVAVERAGAVLFDLHRERVIALTPLEAREPKFLPCLQSTKKRVKNNISKSHLKAKTAVGRKWRGC